jgi:hypothetical protein
MQLLLEIPYQNEVSAFVPVEIELSDGTGWARRATVELRRDDPLVRLLTGKHRPRFLDRLHARLKDAMILEKEAMELEAAAELVASLHTDPQTQERRAEADVQPRQMFSPVIAGCGKRGVMRA